MEINGPLIVSIQDDEASLKRELHISFKPAFVQLNPPDRVKALENYMQQLNSVFQTMATDDPNRLGMETVYQICENLREHIRLDEIDLDETIIIEIQPTISISSFITDNPSIN
jgi:tRNA (Thr-GGU) A37 N-methylase